MTTFLYHPAHQLPATLVGYAKASSAEDRGIYRYKIQLNISNL